mgnify:CR=1 FL=1
MAEDKTKRIRELIGTLRAAGRAYYQESREIMSNFEYDKLYDELSALEAKTGIILSGSPTQQVGYQVLSELPKETHEEPMLSLDKTKSVEDLQQWLGSQKGLLSWKMDGLTVVLTYENGTLAKAVTRGNGEIGEVITPNARAFSNIPLTIAYKGQLIIRGEAVITYTDFERINEEIGDADAKYKNPRNLCSGSVRQLNSKITAERSVHFEAFALVKAEGVDFKNSRKEQFLWLKNQGFEVVHHEEVTAADLPDKVAWFAEQIEHNDIPSDGLVLLYDDIAYGDSLGRTAKFPRNAIAFKWQDEIRETTLSYIEWSPSRTGLINPVAVFEPVELEGTTVSRASVHNISIMEGLKLGVGDKITVYKANMIIPQIADNLTRSGVRDIPKICPVCGGATEIRQTNDVKSLYCTNPECQAKKIKSFTLFVSRDALNIDGLSEATLEKFIGAGFIHEYADLFRLEQRRNSLDFVVDILVDASGSQRPRQENVTLQTYILAETLSRLHIPFRVMSFCTFWDYTILHRMRDYDDPREKNSNIFEYITSSNNRDGLAVKAAGIDLLKRQEDRKLLILLSDGKPYDVLVNRPNARNPKPYRDDYALHDTATEVRRLRQQGVSVLGVFVGEETELVAEQKIFGKDFAYARDIRNFSHMVGSYLRRKIEE